MPDLDAVIEAVTADMFAAACGTPLAPSTVLGWRERLLAARDDYDRAARVAKPTLDRERLHRAMLAHASKVNRAHVCVGGVGSCRDDIADAYEAEP